MRDFDDFGNDNIGPCLDQLAQSGERQSKNQEIQVLFSAEPVDDDFF